MKTKILFIGTLFFLLLTMPSYAQKTPKKQKENKAKIEKLQNTKNKEKKILVKNPYGNNENSPSKTPISKVEEKGIDVPDFMHNDAEDRDIATPGHWHNSNSKTRNARIAQKLTFSNNTFQIKLNNNGFDLYENGSSSIYAKLVPTQKEGLYRYNSSAKNGAAHFDAKGNLILKYLDSNTGKMKEIKFQSN